LKYPFVYAFRFGIKQSSVFFNGGFDVDHGLFGGNFICFVFSRFAYGG
jgi:hypothetical protein